MNRQGEPLPDLLDALQELARQTILLQLACSTDGIHNDFPWTQSLNAANTKLTAAQNWLGCEWVGNCWAVVDALRTTVAQIFTVKPFDPKNAGPMKIPATMQLVLLKSELHNAKKKLEPFISDLVAKQPTAPISAQANKSNRGGRPADSAVAARKAEVTDKFEAYIASLQETIWVQFPKGQRVKSNHPLRKKHYTLEVIAEKTGISKARIKVSTEWKQLQKKFEHIPR